MFHSNYYIPDLVDIQRKGFFYLLEKGIVEEIIKRNPITNVEKQIEIYFYPEYYRLTKPYYSIQQAIFYKKSYVSKLYLPVQLTDRKKKRVYLKWMLIAHFPLMTNRGHFVLNGSARVIINQLVRSPGIYFREHLHEIYSSKWAEKPDTTFRRFYADIICLKGTWLRIECDKDFSMWAKMKKGPKIPLLWFLLGMGLSEKYILNSVSKPMYLLESFTKEIEKLQKANFSKELKYMYVSSPKKAWEQIQKLFKLKKTLRKSLLMKSEKQTRFSLSSFFFPMLSSLRLPTPVPSPCPSPNLDLGFGSPSPFPFREAKGEGRGKPIPIPIPSPFASRKGNGEEDGKHMPMPMPFGQGQRQGQGQVQSQGLGQGPGHWDGFRLSFPKSSIWFPLHEVQGDGDGHAKGDGPAKVDGHANGHAKGEENIKRITKKKNELKIKKIKKKTSLKEKQISKKLETYELGRRWFSNKFMNPRTYDLGNLGRLLINKKLGLTIPMQQTTLTALDVLLATDFLMKMQDSFSEVDDIDHLKNKRVRSSGECIQEILNIGLIRLEKSIRLKLNGTSQRGLIFHPSVFNFHSLINTRPINGAFREFFGTHPLSQFMDQINPLAEITHKRRLTSLGPGGVSRDTATLAIRGIHPSHYGRICPIETPEGKNTGLVNSITTYSKLSFEGFLKSPFFKVYKGQVQKNLGIFFLGPDQEEHFRIATPDLNLTSLGFLPKNPIPVRVGKRFIRMKSYRLALMGVSPLQMISVATSFIPFLEHDDANRALMGSNMQRQAVPLIRPERAFIGTGLEAKVVCDSGHAILAKTSGYIMYSSGSTIFVYAL